MVSKLSDAEQKMELVVNECPTFDIKDEGDKDKAKELLIEIKDALKQHTHLLDFSKRSASEAWLFTKKSSNAKVPQPINNTCQGPMPGTGPHEKTIIHIKAHDTMSEFRPGEL